MFVAHAQALIYILSIAYTFCAREYVLKEISSLIHFLKNLVNKVI